MTCNALTRTLKKGGTMDGKEDKNAKENKGEEEDKNE